MHPFISYHSLQAQQSQTANAPVQPVRARYFGNAMKFASRTRLEWVVRWRRKEAYSLLTAKACKCTRPQLQYQRAQVQCSAYISRDGSLRIENAWPSATQLQVS